MAKILIVIDYDRAERLSKESIEFADAVVVGGKVLKDRSGALSNRKAKRAARLLGVKP